jgi:hypothetical protein
MSSKSNLSFNSIHRIFALENKGLFGKVWLSLSAVHMISKKFIASGNKTWNGLRY